MPVRAEVRSRPGRTPRRPLTTGRIFSRVFALICLVLALAGLVTIVIIGLLH